MGTAPQTVLRILKYKEGPMQKFAALAVALACSSVPLVSATGQSLQLFGVASPLHFDLGGGAVDLAEVLGSQFN